ncbi:hypothetical protein BGZ72_009510 [Mortierella alpina]|nr:hypothetical protein BGZ72_009510 [Mortierella alpina]
MVDEAWGLDGDALKRVLGNVYGTVSNSLGTMLRHLKRASKPNDQQDNFRAMHTFLERVSESDDQQVNTEAMRALLERITKSNDSQDSRLQRIQTAKLLLPLLEQGPKRNKLLELLASHCYHQFNATNEWQSLEDALTHLGEVLEAATEVDVDYARWAVMYSKCLQARYMRGRNETDLENAIDWAEKSTDLTRALLTEGAKIESLVRALGNLWLCLFTNVHQRNNTTDEDFEKMMSAAQDAAKIAVDNSLSIELLLETKNHLGMSYQLQWDRWDRWEERKYEDLDRSLQLGWEVLTAMRGLSSKANTSDALAMALSNHSFRLQRAYLCYVKDGSLPHKITVPSGQYLLDQAVDLLAESTTIPGTELLSALTNTIAFVTDIRNFPHEYRSAAAHLHLNGCPFEALRILEKGRGIAHAIHQDMHKGFRFPRDLSAQEMMSLAENEDIVVINITDLRSEAIIVRRDSVYSVHLPDLDEEVLSEKSWEIQSRLAKEKDQLQGHINVCNQPV